MWASNGSNRDYHQHMLPHKVVVASDNDELRDTYL